MLYRRRPPLHELEPYYSRHISAMTSEDLHGKSDIAAELAARDALLSKCFEALVWCSGSNDFQTDGVASEGWEKICRPLIAELLRTLGLKG